MIELKKRDELDLAEFFESEPDETVIFAFRPHPMAFFRSGLMLVLIFLIPYSATLFSDLSPVFFALAVLSGLVGWIYGYRLFFIYRNSFNVLTTSRVIAINQRGFFDRVTAESPVARVQSVRIETKGVLQTIFSFGNIYIQSSGASESGDVIMVNLPAPDRARADILKTRSRNTD